MTVYQDTERQEINDGMTIRDEIALYNELEGMKLQ